MRAMMSRELGLGFEAVHPGGLDDRVHDGGASPPVSEPANSQFLRPKARGRMARSAALLVISSRPSVV